MGTGRRNRRQSAGLNRDSLPPFGISLTYFGEFEMSASGRSGLLRGTGRAGGHPAQQESFLTSFLKACAASLIPSTAVR